jgi:SAM-dependent methyltransferase
MKTAVSLDSVRAFWQANPVAAAGIDAAPGTPEFFATFDAIREDDSCEPYELSDRIHGYTSSRGLKVLDVGCGNGYVLSRYARQGAEVTGVDLTGTAVDLSRKRFALENLPGTFLETDGETLPFPDNSFDIVCSMGVLHHTANPAPMVHEMHRVLKPGGRCIVMLYHRYSWKNVVLLRLRRVLDPQFKGKTHQQALNYNDGPDCPLALVYSRGEARALLAEFTDHEFMKTLLSWKQLLMWPPHVRFAEKNFPASSGAWPARLMGWNLNVHCRKAGS